MASAEGAGLGTARYEGLAANLARVESERAREQAFIQDQATKLKTINTAAEAFCVSHRGEVGEVKGVVNRVSAVIRAHETLSQQHAATEAALAAATAGNERLTAALAAEQEAKAEVSAELRETRGTLRESQAQAAALGDSLARAEAVIADMRAQLTALTARAEQAERCIDSLMSSGGQSVDLEGLWVD